MPLPSAIIALFLTDSPILTVGMNVLRVSFPEPDFK